MAQKWFSVVGIGEDGLPGLSAVAQSLIQTAAVLVGSDRQLALIPPSGQQRLRWRSPLLDTLPDLLACQGQNTCVLASGDPLCYGIGTTLLRHIPLAEMTLVPAPSTFSLACARLGWSLPDIETLSLCGRPLALLRAYLYPGARLLILSADRETPQQVAQSLTQLGFGSSALTVLEHLGGSQERLLTREAATFSEPVADLNVIALDCRADRGTRPLSRLPGLPDDAYHHDGQLTKREVRAVTLAALAPLPGERLWDIGAGCGSIAIEWMRSHPRCQAITIEKARSNYIADNATALGTPLLQIIAGEAPAALQDLPSPNAIFIGGGITAPGLVEQCWNALPTGGRLVANVVTLEGEQALYAWQQQVGGTLTRIGIERAEPIGQFWGWKPRATITQWTVVKSA